MADYGYQHRRTRAQWEPIVNTGRVTCSRFSEDPSCPGPIEPGAPWDLEHDDNNPTAYRGPGHAACNRRAGALKRLGRLPTDATITTYAW